MIDVLVYDDLEDLGNLWVSNISDASEHMQVASEYRHDFNELLLLIHDRRLGWRESEELIFEISDHPADTASIIVVDYDLLGYSGAADTTGSRLAYLLRCFTRCGVILELNRYGPNSFDLSLGGFTEDFADLHLGDRQTGNPGLWRWPFEGFRPWHWPILSRTVDDFELCVADVLENFEVPILEFLHLTNQIDWIPRRAWEFLGGPYAPEIATVGTFVTTGREARASKDKLPLEQSARVAAARLRALLNGIVLSEQNLLVDAPHLMPRVPSLMNEDVNNMEVWNLLCDPSDPTINRLMDERLKAHEYPKPHWLTRPAWFWQSINNDETIDEVRSPWDFTPPEWVFCEDVSRFVRPEYARAFRADVSPPFINRYVFKRDTPGAQEQLQHLGSGNSQDLELVDYVPEFAFSGR